ncbi:hypothetical protein DL95DRAFT_460136 [Leptodontidium sp. 2 PMI_412]|nr:hypothetical protein DL95DRAFT_460136 [Leptodontidium sp. 2 PMI_412]
MTDRGPGYVLYRGRSYYESQNLLKERSTDCRTSQAIGATSYTRVPTSGPIEVSPPVPSKAQFQEYLGPPQTNNHQARKRGLDKSIETGAERHPKRARLTKRNLKAFEKNGRTRKKVWKRAKVQLVAISEVITVYDRFELPALVFENGVLDPLNSVPPENLGYLQDRLNRARDTKSPTESEYQDFVYRTQEAPNEQTKLLETSKLLKEYGRGYRRVYNQALSNFPKSVGFNTGLSAPQPDMIEGLDLREFKPFPVRQELGGAAVPTSETNATTLPHLAGEWKAGGKDMIQARTQAAYDGACMVYGRHEARSFLKSPDPVGHAYIQTFTTDGTTLNTFAHYLSESQDQVKYYQYPTSSSFLISSYEDFKQSRRRLRNQQDDANETSVQLRDELNEKWLTNHRSPVTPSVLSETADSTATNSYEYKEERT